MSSSENPYAPPLSEPIVYDAQIVEGQGLWRKGNILVMWKGAQLPERCVKSNQPTQRRLKRSLYWHHPAIYLSVLISIWIYVILALVLRKSAIIYIGLSDAWFARRHRAMFIGWLLALTGLALFGLSFHSLVRSDAFPWLLVASPLVFLAGAVYGLLAARMVAPQRISHDYVWLKGVHPDFLADLPEWPYHP
ncbi:MAG: hypothetical protein GX575_28880 [Candidatus Anammoximicrobium sp.]|nr:hypothetical protein [Candidatus Anammoximicrobium sp.]